ncbi:PREDICTED: uncharacterized protein LOC106749394 isoform X2 [Dinoponera quadriceps]|nr:PREDICTED: uncharacterized protein LOC106749394 isoform X2 [Dinoponera quadriceps]XP_014484282.1 PREDICTED: uncharacterized protein LOC106749394 isoform X2 [Dinoponera quadriceps]XP_014484283.1 PREDICTED: uncharacterized protein LOC106749394 isoform X2 [Dinoponera quadriceps]
MRILLVTVAILVVVEVSGTYQNWENFFNNPGLRNGRGNNRGPPWAYPLQQDYLQNIALGSDVEWVCRNAKTNDMMIITADSTRTTSQNPGRGPWRWQNVPPGHRRHEQEGNYWTQPLIIVQQGVKDGNNEGGNPSQTPSPNTSPETNNDNQQQTTPKSHGGEGLIDIRFGQNAS